MLKDLSEKIDNQNENLKNISKCFETVSFIIKNNTPNKEILNDLKNALNDLKPILTDLENEIANLENAIPQIESSPDKEQIYDNNTLLISELQNKVILPYTITDLQKIIDQNDNFNNFEQIIDELYTLPLDNYKNTSTSRFKEAYNLMRKKQKASIIDSLSIALEVCLNHSLHPAIITACKNLDELDTYLDCLSENSLDKFNLFEIKFEILPHT